MVSRLTYALLAAGFFLAAPAAEAAMQLAPGLWQQTESGTEDGKPVAREVFHDCMSNADARDPVKALTHLQAAVAGHCKTIKLHAEGNTLSFAMACGDPQHASIVLDMNVTFLNARHYAGTIASTITMAGHKASSNKHLDSVWVGPDCNAQH
jgi:hypothetical protein